MKFLNTIMSNIISWAGTIIFNNTATGNIVDFKVNGISKAIVDNTGKFSTDGVNVKLDSMSSGKILGRATSATGTIEEITLGTGLSFDGTTLNSTGGSSSSVVIKTKEFISTSNQTIFTITNGSYIPNENMIEVFISGVSQPKSSYTESSSTVITLSNGIPEGILVVLKWFESISVASSGSSAVKGNALIDFGSGIGTNYIRQVVNDINIKSDSFISLTLQGSSVDHNKIEHEIIPMKLSYDNIIVGTSFEVIAYTDLRLTGKLNVNYIIN